MCKTMACWETWVSSRQGFATLSHEFQQQPPNCGAQPTCMCASHTTPDGVSKVEQSRFKATLLKRSLKTSAISFDALP